MKTDDYLHTANLVICAAGAIGADGGVTLAANALGGTFSIRELATRLSGKTPDLQKRTATALKHALEKPTVHLPKDAGTLIPEMLAAAPLSAAEVMQAHRNPDKLCTLILGKLERKKHQTYEIQEAFRRVLVPILQEVIDDPASAEALNAAFQAAVGETLAYMAQRQDVLIEQSADKARELQLTEKLFISLARRINTRVSDIDAAHAELENAVQIAASERDRGQLPSNFDDAVDTVVAKIDALTGEGLIDEALAAATAALAAQEAKAEEESAKVARLRDKAVAQAVLARSVDDVVALEVGALREVDFDFQKCCDKLNHWLFAARNQGLEFNYQVTRQLALGLCPILNLPLEKGTALRMAGVASLELGARDAGLTHLEIAFDDLTRSQEYLTKEHYRQAWSWAENSRANALMDMGLRLRSLDKLQEAADTFNSALTVITRTTDSYSWAGTQMNLGNLYGHIHSISPNAASPEDAVRAYRLALEVWDPKTEPYFFASTKMNIGTALRMVGEQAGDIAKIEEGLSSIEEAAVYWQSVKNWMNWAMSVANLATLHRARFDLTKDPASLDLADKYLLQARPVFEKHGATQNLGILSTQTAEIAARRAALSDP